MGGLRKQPSKAPHLSRKAQVRSSSVALADFRGAVFFGSSAASEGGLEGDPPLCGEPLTPECYRFGEDDRWASSFRGGRESLLPFPPISCLWGGVLGGSSAARETGGVSRAVLPLGAPSAGHFEAAQVQLGRLVRVRK